MKNMMTSDTIAAIATALTNSGIGIIRVSGNEAFDIVDRIFRPKNKRKKKIKRGKTYTVHYGHIQDGDEIIDEVLCHYNERGRTAIQLRIRLR